ncbi:MAG: response regulator [Pirellulales bacterium]
MKADESPAESERHVRRILIADDDDVLREQLRRAFVRRGFVVSEAANCTDAIAAILAAPCDLAVVDLRMPGESGMQLLVELRQRSPGTKVLMLTGFGSIANAVEAVRLGATNYVSKPAHADEILAAFEELDEPRSSRSSGAEGGGPSLAQAEWEHIQRVLADCEGNISQAAHRLGISRRSLQRKLRKRAPDS